MATLPLRVRLGYATGHVLNDLTATLWFTYYLVYVHDVVLFSDILAGSLLLIGQVVDAMSTPIVGLASDAIEHGICRYGKRKSWHLLGSLCVVASCPFMYLRCLVCTSGVPDWTNFLYYTLFISLFQFGWASVQTAHLAMIPELSGDAAERTELGAWRNAMTVFSSVVVYALAFIFLLQTRPADTPTYFNVTTTLMSTTTVPTHNVSVTHSLLEDAFGSTPSASDVSPRDASAFSYLTFTTVGVGCLFTLVFHLLVPEGSLQRSSSGPTANQRQRSVNEQDDVRVVAQDNFSDDERLLPGRESRSSTRKTATAIQGQINEGSEWQVEHYTESAENTQVEVHENSTVPENQLELQEFMTWRNWLKQLQFWEVGILWALTRMLYNLPQVYLPLFVLSVLKADKTSIAIVPLVVYVAGFATSLCMKAMNRAAGRKLSYLIGLTAVAGFCIWSYFLPPFSEPAYGQVYAVAVLLGIGTTGILVTSLGMTADLISTHVESSAFVYGIMSLLDKLSCGAAVQLLQAIKPPDSDAASASFLRTIESFVIGGIALLALIMLGILAPQRIGHLRRVAVSSSDNSTVPNGAPAVRINDDM